LALPDSCMPLQSLLDAGASLASVDAMTVDASGTPLLAAAKAGRSAAVRKLAAAGADREARDSEGCTALMSAAHAGDVNTIRVLLEAGADVEARALSTPGSPLNGSPALHFAAMAGQEAAIAALLVGGADKDARNPDGHTALHFAAAAGHGKALRALLRAGADPHARDADGCTALDLARSAGNAEVLDELLLGTLGADVSTQPCRCKGSRQSPWRPLAVHGCPGRLPHSSVPGSRGVCLRPMQHR
jgi:ankyrin repeat protein